MSTADVVRMLGEPHDKMSLADFLKSPFITGVFGINEISPFLKAECWVYVFSEVEYVITIWEGKVLFHTSS